MLSANECTLGGYVSYARSSQWAILKGSKYDIFNYKV